MTRPLETLTYTVPETAAVLNVSRPTVQRLIDSGDLPVVRIGRRVLISKAELERWLSTRSVAS